MGTGSDRGGRATLARTIAVAITVLGASGFGAKAEDQDLWQRDNLSGDWGGVRTALKKKGIEVGINYIGETFSILSGGLQHETSYEGRLDIKIDADLEKLIGWTGGNAEVRAFQIHDIDNRNASLTGSIADPSNIDAVPTTRLFTAWFQQEVGKAGSIRVGQLAADDEFFVSTTANGLINSTFGWANVISANLPSGGPAYPLATPGARFQINAAENISLLAAIFSGDPAGVNCNGSPQGCNRYGTTFSFSGGAFAIGEAQYQTNQEKDSKGLATAYKFGVWYHSGNFADQHFGFSAAGTLVTLAVASSPLFHRGDWGIYGVADQMVWRGRAESVSIFARAGATPSDRNLVSWYVDGGVSLKGLISGRNDDALTFGIAYSRISPDAAALDQDKLALNGPPYPIRDAEIVYELSYLAQIAPWWTVQPDIQYIVHPGGGVPAPAMPASAVRNAFVIGARTTVTF